MKPIRLIELFSGIGAQASALSRLGYDFESYKTSDWEVNAVASYRAIHNPEDNTDYSKDLSIDEVTNALIKFSVSVDGKSPMTEEQIQHKNEEWKRTTYNNFRATNNVGSIVNIHAEDLEIVDTDKYTYIMTYSFPCQDLSLAGKRKGMTKGTSTRSGLLWEVERVLSECTELPQILLMENVPQVHAKNNLDSFLEWIKFLRSIGYKSFYQDLNAKDYGVAQNRDRTFMVSFLEDRTTFNFPKPVELDKCIEDYLEEDVTENYFIKSKKAQELIERLESEGKLP